MRSSSFRDRTLGFLVMVGAIGCGGGGGAPGAVAPAFPTAPPSAESPSCVPAIERAKVLSAESDGSNALFCVEAGVRACFSVDLATGVYTRREQPFRPQSADLSVPLAKLDTTPTEVRVCKAAEPDVCQVLRPAPDGSVDTITAAVNASGQTAAIVNGIATSGYQVVEVWDVASNRRTKVITYARDAGNDQRCGFPQVLDDVIFISATNCESRTASGLLYSLSGDLLGRVGGQGFGTFQTRAVQVSDLQWAFLEERGGAIALQDVKTGAVIKSIDVTSLWPGGAAGARGASGESLLLRGGEGSLIVIAGAPVVGAIAQVNLETGEVVTIHPPPCAR